VEWADFGADGGVEDVMRRHFDRIPGRGMRAMCGFALVGLPDRFAFVRWYWGESSSWSSLGGGAVYGYSCHSVVLGVSLRSNKARETKSKGTQH